MFDPEMLDGEYNNTIIHSGPHDTGTRRDLLFPHQGGVC